MRGKPATDSTKYNSLYPTDSANKEIAIPRLAAHRDDGSKGESNRNHSCQHDAGQRTLPVRKVFPRDTVTWTQGSIIKDVGYRRSENIKCPH
jgi:hypothetical protein